MRPTCRVVRTFAPSQADGRMAELLDNHVGSCLSCQAEVARYGKLRRQLATMADLVIAAPEPLAAAVATAIASGAMPPESASAMTHTARVVAAAGAAAAAAAGAAAVIAWRYSKPAIR